MNIKIMLSMIICLVCFACQPTHTNDHQMVETEQINKESTNMTTTEVSKDTTGVYRITNLEAREFIVQMNDNVNNIESALNNKNLNSIPQLINIARDYQNRQVSIQNNLDENDRELFSSYTKKISSRLVEIGDKLSKM